VTGRAQDTAGQAARVMYHRGLKLLAVADEAGRLAGIVSRTDALAVFGRTDEEIRVELRAG
jgi:CBS-domain-containing membrane protein